MSVRDVEDLVGNMAQEHVDFDCSDMQLHPRRFAEADRNWRVVWSVLALGSEDDF